MARTTTKKSSRAHNVKKASVESMDTFELLKHDHNEVKALFKQILDNHAFDPNVYHQINYEMQLHMHAEEEYLYPVLENEEKTRDLILEAYEEHTVARDLMGKIDKSTQDEEKWLAKIKVLCDVFEHHVEEEEKDLFKLAKSIIGKEQDQEIADKIRQEKQEAEAA